jgi:PhnB protein
MGAGELWKVPGLVPSLAFEDVPKAVEWLNRVFGFQERSEARLSWPGGCLAWMELGDVLVSVTTEGAHGLRRPDDLGGVSVALKIYVDDVDEHFRRAKGAGATILSEPEDGFWGGRIYRATDLGGHHWEFSQRGRDLDPGEWRLPPGLVRGAGTEPF